MIAIVLNVFLLSLSSYHWSQRKSQPSPDAASVATEVAWSPLFDQFQVGLGRDYEV